jgi:hypothetical protein
MVQSRRTSTWAGWGGVAEAARWGGARLGDATCQYAARAGRRRTLGCQGTELGGPSLRAGRRRALGGAALHCVLAAGARSEGRPFTACWPQAHARRGGPSLRGLEVLGRTRGVGGEQHGSAEARPRAREAGRAAEVVERQRVGQLERDLRGTGRAPSEKRARQGRQAKVHYSKVRGGNGAPQAGPQTTGRAQSWGVCRGSSWLWESERR